MIQSRYRRILWFFARAILSIIAWDLLLPKLGFRALSQRTRAERLRQTAVRFRALAVQMGGVMIKVGQFLSARLDILPPVITDELSGLQDEVRPESFEAIEQVLQEEMDAAAAERFFHFERSPLASASIGQVHQAQLFVRGKNGSPPSDPFLEPILDRGMPVVVKVQRPNIQQIVDTDLAALRVVSRWIHYYPPIRKRVNTPALLEEFSRSLYEETDYLLEGKNAETFAENFADQSQVRVPCVFWSHTTRRVLTLEEIHGIKITEYDRIEAAGISRAEVADRLLDTYLKQIFEDRFFHADPHPGNLFILPGAVEADGRVNWQLVFVDFGMTGHVAPQQLAALREALIAIGTQDVPRLIRSYQMMGLLLPSADLDMLEKATRHVFERFWGKSTTEMVNLGHQEAVAFAKEFGSLLYELPFQVPENLIMLGRCVGILSGICTGLNPDFNVWNNIMPYAQRLIQAEGGGRNVIVDEALNVLRSVISLPIRTEAIFQKIEQGRLEVQVPALKNSLSRVERQLQQLTGAILFAAFFAGSIQLYLANETGLAMAGGAAGLLTFLWMIFRR